MAGSGENKLVERLDQMIRVLALQVATDKSITERARLLKLAGLDNHTIAVVLNTSDATIRTLTSNLYRREPLMRRRKKAKRR